ncbi:hypothetical protein [Herbidospora daliensis]|uniref:hypothetical protein n=1 Tax=Herbidospora daliensis TaxID=295585 RepID=UPI0007853DA0|nr:hypothetical protein [Herbidospora daliensis]
MATNEVSGDDTPIMVGRVLDKSRQQIDNERQKREAEKAASGGTGKAKNVVTGNSTVGRQADEIHGGVTQTFFGRQR